MVAPFIQKLLLSFPGYPLIDDKIYNSKNWGEQKGKNAEYGMLYRFLENLKFWISGKSYEELAEIIRVSHRSENWMEYKNPEYDQMMEEIATKLDEVFGFFYLKNNFKNFQITPDDPNIRPEDRPSTDKICLNCNVQKKVVSFVKIKFCSPKILLSAPNDRFPNALALFAIRNWQMVISNGAAWLGQGAGRTSPWKCPGSAHSRTGSCGPSSRRFPSKFGTWEIPELRQSKCPIEDRLGFFRFFSF